MTRSEILTVLKSNIRTIVDGAADVDIQESHSILDDLHADSLQAVEVVSRTMKQLNIRVSRTELSKAKNVGQLVDIFEKASAN
jgi:acyl carrier protein